MNIQLNVVTALSLFTLWDTYTLAVTQFQEETWRLRTGYYGVRRAGPDRQEIQKSLETIITCADQLLAAEQATVPALRGSEILDVKQEKERAQEYLELQL